MIFFVSLHEKVLFSELKHVYSNHSRIDIYFSTSCLYFWMQFIYDSTQTVFIINEENQALQTGFFLC